jgi:hypothetical protein
MRNGPGMRENAGNCEKDVFSRERTQLSLANKGLNVSALLKTNWFLMQTNSERTPKRRQKPALLWAAAGKWWRAHVASPTLASSSRACYSLLGECCRWEKPRRT